MNSVSSHQHENSVSLTQLESSKFELPAELWSIVKEYAGIYHLTTKWNKIVNIGLERLYYDFYLKCDYVASILDLKWICFNIGGKKHNFKEAKKRNSVIKMKQML